jgi:hypothetical protein
VDFSVVKGVNYLNLLDCAKAAVAAGSGSQLLVQKSFFYGVRSAALFFRVISCCCQLLLPLFNEPV